jgi:hypothetical protein
MKRAQCPTHGMQPCYTACTCVVKFGNAPAHVVRPSKAKSGIGEILCNRTDHEMHEMQLVCAMCATDHKWNVVPTS